MSGEFMENCGFEGKMLCEVVRQCAPCDSRDTTTSEQLAEIDRDMADIERQVAELVEEAQRADYKTQELPEYTPPEGWRVLAVGERLQFGDMTVRKDGYCYSTERVGYFVGANQRYIRPIEPQPQREPQPESDTELRAQVAFLKGREVTLGTRLQQEREVTTRLRGELESVQNLLGESRQRVTELEELVSSLRTINRGCENAVRDAGKENFALKNQLESVKAELVTQAETSRRLQIELDAAQQVPQAIADRFEEGWNQGTARAVETIIAWLEPIRLADSAYLANATMQHLPQIMRHLTGLDSHAID